MAAPLPVPALPDAPRVTPYAMSASAGPVNVGFAIFGDSTDYTNWIELFLDGVQITSGWTLSSPSGSLSTLARPITDAQITFGSPISGSLKIVSAQRPRRLAQNDENRGVTARDFNQLYTMLIALERETWDLRSRLPLIPPDATSPLLPAKAARAGLMIGFDTNGNFGTFGTVGAGLISAGMADVVAAPDHATAAALLGVAASNRIIGEEMTWPGLGPIPSLWLDEDASAIVRATFPELFAILAPTINCVVASGNTTVTGFASTAMFDAGWPVEGAAIAGGTTIQSIAGPTSIVLSQPPTNNSSSVVLFPYGNGDGSTTFNLPDARGVSFAGLDLAQAHLPNGQFLNRLLGEATHTLLITEMPAHNHVVNDPTHNHPGTVGTGSALLGFGAATPTTIPTGAVAVGGNGTGISIQNAGGGLPHNNVQPTRTRRIIIYAGH